MDSVFPPIDFDRASLSLADRVAIITGASRGLGEAIAIAYARAGADVILAARTQSELERVAGKAGTFGQRVISVPTDVTDSTQCNRLVERAIDAFGKIDILVNNAGDPLARGGITELDDERWDRLVRSNLYSVFYCCRAVAPHMIERRYGKVINMSSQFGLVGYPNRSAYAAAKGGVVQFTRALAAEWAPHQICVNALAPTHIETPHNSERVNQPSFVEEMLPQIWDASDAGKTSSALRFFWRRLRPISSPVRRSQSTADGRRSDLGLCGTHAHSFSSISKQTPRRCIVRFGALGSATAIVLVSTVVCPAYALWEEIQVTEKNIRDLRHSFRIETKDIESMKEFVVTVSEKKNKLSPIVHGRLRIVSDEGSMGHLFVEGSRNSEGTVEFWFRISPKFLKKSRFEFEEFAAGTVYEDKGGVRHIPLPGGTSHWFYLRDFAGAK